MATSVPSDIYVSDSQSGFRAFSPRVIELIQFNSVDFSVESEMQFLAQDHSLRVAEVPITIRYQTPRTGCPWVFVPEKNEPKRIKESLSLHRAQSL